jgi:predicted XRE-type DNA-binding protein
VLENFFPISNAHSSYSADFDTNDYNSTDIEVVLETLFDDDRLHLTEKSLRPVAVGQPFILAGTYGSLEYLKSYGFQTFSDVWDESYDQIEDPAERLIQIAELMKYISTWLPHQRERNMAQAQAIAEYNRQRFFSQDFFNQVINELKTNLTSAFDQLDDPKNYKSDYWNKLASTPEIIDFVSANQETCFPTRADLDHILDLLKTKTQ